MIPKVKDPNVIRTIGLVALILGSVAHFFFKPSPQLQDTADFVYGVTNGIAIGCLLLSLRSWRGRPSA